MGHYLQTIAIEHDNALLHAEFCLATIPLPELEKITTSFLHDKELEYLATLTFNKRRQDYLLSHFAVKQVVARYLNTASLTAILFDYGVFRFPVLYYSGSEKIQVSNTHSKQWGVAIAFPETHPMGIDLEVIDPEKVSVIATQLTQEEKTLIDTQTDSATETLHTLFWTLKEALSKVLRTGMTSPFEIYAINKVEKLTDVSWASQFKNFSQYDALSFTLDQFICSIVYPKQIQLSIDIKAMQDWFSRQA